VIPKDPYQLKEGSFIEFDFAKTRVPSWGVPDAEKKKEGKTLARKKNGARAKIEGENL